MNALVIGIGALLAGLGLASWAYLKSERLRNELVAAGINLATGGAILGVSALVDKWSQAWIAMGGASTATIVFFLVMWIVGRRRPDLDTRMHGAGGSMGLTGYWCDYQSTFKKSTGKDFGSVVREMVLTALVLCGSLALTGPNSSALPFRVLQSTMILS